MHWAPKGASFTALRGRSTRIVRGSRTETSQAGQKSSEGIKGASSRAVTSVPDPALSDHALLVTDTYKYTIACQQQYTIACQQFPTDYNPVVRVPYGKLPVCSCTVWETACNPVAYTLPLCFKEALGRSLHITCKHPDPSPSLHLSQPTTITRPPKHTT